MIVTKAQYYPSILPEYRTNPLIEALPEKVDDDSLIDILSIDPEHNQEERSLPAFHRVEYLTRLSSFRQVLPVHLDVFRAIEYAIKEGYAAKNPLSPTTTHYQSYPDVSQTIVKPFTGTFHPRGSGITMIGESGVGKTCLLEKILHCFSDVIKHHSYKGRPLPLTQVVWIKVDCPSDANIRGLCHAILHELDRKLGINSTPAKTISTLLEQIEARMKFCYLGILIIDEMQYLRSAKSGGSANLINFLHSIVNKLGIPVLFCANPPFDQLISQSFRTARRAENNGYFDIGRLKNDELWEVFLEGLWRLQWTKVETTLTRSLSDKMYELSVGNFDLAVRIYREVQRQLISSADDEIITTYALESAAENCIRATDFLVRKIRESDTTINILKRRSLLKNRDVQELNDSENEKINLVEKNRFLSIPGDLNKGYHNEFKPFLMALLNSDSLMELIQDPDLIQRCAGEDNALLALIDEGLICSDPLTYFCL